MKKTGLILLFIIFAAVLSGRTSPHPVFIRVTAEGKIEQQTFNTLKPCPIFSNYDGYPVECEAVSVTTHSGKSDTTRDVRAGRSNTFSFTRFSIQDEYKSGSIYPEDPETCMPGIGYDLLPSAYDTIVIREFWIDPWMCGDYGGTSYTVKQEWHLNKKRDRVMKVIVTRDSTPEIWQYGYLNDGRMNSILITGGFWADKKFYGDTSTTEFLYNGDKLCTNICTHTGLPFLYPAEPIAIWKQGLDSAFRKNRRFNLTFSYRGAKLKEFISYEYNEMRLTSSLGFNNSFSALYSDSLFYNEKNQLVRSRFYQNEAVDEIVFTYGKRGRVASKSEVYYYDYRQPTRNELNLSETYSYGKGGRMSTIDYHSLSEDYPNHVIVHVYYPKDK